MDKNNHQQLEQLITRLLTQRGKCVSRAGQQASYELRMSKHALIIRQWRSHNQPEHTAVYHYSRPVYVKSAKLQTPFRDETTHSDWKSLLPRLIQDYNQLPLSFITEQPETL